MLSIAKEQKSCEIVAEVNALFQSLTTTSNISDQMSGF